MAEFFAELKRRQMFRAAAAYAVVAWLLLQIVNNVAPVLDLPPWVSRAFLLALVIGLPIALLFVWMRELAPADAAAPRAAVSKLDYVLIGALAAVLLFMGYQQIVPPRQEGVDAAKEAALSPRTGVSLAVLPFANLSDDASQEFFSDGITQEIITALARIPDLRVVARGSASQFKGERTDLRAVGQALGASHLIEGTVRKAGTRVRITAQLVKADDGVNIWVDSYDRELTDVFAIQEEIATAIARALSMPLGLRPGEQLVANRDIDAQSYEQFLRAKAVRLRGAGASPELLAILEPLVARNPDYAPAWALLATAYYMLIVNRANVSAADLRAVREQYLPKAEMAARRSIQLDPDSVDAYLSLANATTGTRRLAVSEDLYAKAFAIEPTNPEVLNSYSRLLAHLARIKDALAMMQQLHDLEPFVPLYSGNLAEALWLNGQDEAAIALYKDNLGRLGSGAGAGLPRVYAALGRYEEAADSLLRSPPPIGSEARREQIAAATRLLRSAPNKAPAPETLPRLGNLGFVYLHIGAPERALEFHEQEDVPAALLWHPSYAPVRQTERFKALVRQIGLVEYWRERGWPEFCKPVGADDFECS